MMKDDRITKLLIIILIGLVGWLIILSFQKDGQINNLILQFDQLKSKVQEVPEQDSKDAAQLPPAPGPKGEVGPVGPVGASGQSIQGKPGGTVVGPVGPQGPVAPNNYELWIQAGNQGTLLDFFDSLKGQTGGDGRTPQIRCNPTKLQTEWRFVGDTSSHALIKLASGEVCAPGSEVWK